MTTLIVIALVIAVLAFVADWLELRGHASRNPSPLAVKITQQMHKGILYTVTERAAARPPAKDRRSASAR